MGTILAAGNTDGGAYLTFAFPVGVFLVVAAILYVLLFSRPVPRVPPRRIALAAHAGPPSPEAAQAASVAGGMPVASGGGATESGTEPGGAVSAAGSAGATATAPDSGETTTGSVSGEASGPAQAGDAGSGPTEGTTSGDNTSGDNTEASE